MAASIIGGLLDSGHPASSLSAADPFPQSLARLGALAPVALHGENEAAAHGADVIILAVKPQVMAEAAESVAGAVRDGAPVVISIAAGITIDSLQQWLGEEAAIVRCMPNTPALLRCGASALFASDTTSAAQRGWADYVMSAVGTTLWVEQESQLDAVTALSGSGPAYFFLFMEAMIEAGCRLGLTPEDAGQLAMQTGLGAARMALESDADLRELRRRVTSPGGTTERAIERFEHGGLRELVADAMQAARDRAAEMARDMG